MKNLIIVTGGAGFVGSNLINYYYKNLIIKSYQLTTIAQAHKKIVFLIFFLKYINADTTKIFKVIKNKKKIKVVFHFGEFARIYQVLFKWINVLILIQ